MTILADSCCDLSPELLKKTQAKIAPLTITIDDTHYVDDGTVDIPPYLAAMKASKNPVRSACPSPDLYAEDIRATESLADSVTMKQSPSVAVRRGYPRHGGRLLHRHAVRQALRLAQRGLAGRSARAGGYAGKEGARL